MTKHAESKKALLAQRRLLKILAQDLPRAEDERRRDLAAALDRNVVGNLAACRMQLQGIQGTLEERPEVAEELEAVTEKLGKVITDGEHLSFDLSSPLLAELGLIPAIEREVEHLLSEKGVEWTLHDDSVRKPLGVDVRRIVFRTVRELLLNVANHAGASEVEVSVTRAGDRMVVAVSDDGCGFDAETLLKDGPRRGASGLFRIQEWISQVGGEVEIESEPGKGCSVTLKVPLAGQGTSPGGVDEEEKGAPA